MSDGFFQKHFVLRSTPESIDAGKISWVACAEVVASVAAYWWIAITWDTYLHLWISLIMAPLVLLRSAPAVELGARWFQVYMHQASIKLGSFIDAVMIVLALLAIFLFTYTMYSTWKVLAPYLGSSWQFGFISLLSPLIAATVVKAIAGVTAERKILVVIGLITGAIGVWLEETLAIAGMVTIAVSVATVISTKTKVEIEVAKDGYASGILVRALLTRICASLYHLDSGIRQLPVNWRKTAFLIDLFHAPVLIPVPKGWEPILSFEELLLARERERNPRIKWISFTLAILTLFTPALLYRYAIKSTCWFYLPLIYLTKSMPTDRLIWVRSHATEVIEWLRLFLASVTLALLIPAVINPEFLRLLMQAVHLGELPFNAFSLLFVLDGSKMLPWQYFTLPSAVITIILFFWLDKLAKREKAGADLSSNHWKVTLAVTAYRLRNICVIFWLAIAFYYTMQFLLNTCTLPAWAVWLLSWHFPAPVCS